MTSSTVVYISDSGQYKDVSKYLLLFILVDKLHLNIGKWRSLLSGGLSERYDRLKPKAWVGIGVRNLGAKNFFILHNNIRRMSLTGRKMNENLGRSLIIVTICQYLMNYF